MHVDFHSLRRTTLWHFLAKVGSDANNNPNTKYNIAIGVGYSDFTSPIRYVRYYTVTHLFLQEGHCQILMPVVWKMVKIIQPRLSLNIRIIFL